ncbi:TetR/AcrR family transcriptional regulator [Actinoplanes sp. G11-F43]|uniref:TetR/AcrR family transcriptional regulator n=1 Tax=Actinoplanes sp. G11-F43 TaxID=3424130 RepID=UPI003D339AE5
MAPKARREGDQLRGELLAAATELASAPRPVTIPSLRAIARACDVSATAVYRHFPSQADLNRALLLRVHAAFEESVLDHDDPTLTGPERLRAMARAYVNWGLAQPGMYQLLFESKDQLDEESSISDVADRLLPLAAELLGGEDEVERLWTGLHGIVSLRLHKPHTVWRYDAETEAGRLAATLSRTGV